MSPVEFLPTDDLGPAVRRELRAWLLAAYDGDFADEDFAHALGGVHALVRDARGIVAHAAVVPRTLVCDGRPLRAGYVEAVATRRDARRRGHATRVVAALGGRIARDHDVGALSTGLPALYARLGWERWRGASYVEAPGGRRRTPDDDDGLMVLRTARTPPLDLAGDIVADWRDGDVW